MPKQLCIFLLIFLASMPQNFYVSSTGAPGDTVGTIASNRYGTHAPSDKQMQQQHPKPHSPPHNPNAVVGGSSSNIAVTPQALHHSPSGSGGHVDNRNSYNLLSEAMSQAVSNEFSTLGSGSADGACHADDLDCYSGNVQDRLGMEAIRTLHRQLDDDDNGNIDLSESDDFLREELKYDSGYEKRQKAFHFNDDMHISVKELWEAWLRSEVHNWTIEQTTDWLAQSVQLPQYVELFKLHKVTGAALPRLAVNNMHYVSNVLGIKDPIHKQKIALKAMDVVLFGPPRETGTRWKDYILVTLLLSAIIGCWYAYQQNKNAKRHLRRMAQDMEGLQRAEQSLQEMQKELERARMEQENVATEKMDLERRLKEAPALTTSNSDLEVQQLKKEIEMLRSELSRAEIELVDNCWAPPPQLQSWLQYTYELENKNHLKKRIAAEKQLQSAREACEKLRKKRSSLVGAFVSTHGKSIDDVDRSIVEARNSLGEVTNELQERLHRWKQIESCLGLNIVNNNGLPYLESVLYGRNGGSSKGSRGRMTSSTDDLDDESVQGMFDSYNRSPATSGGIGGGTSNSMVSSSANTIRDDSSCSDDGIETQSVQFYLGGAPTPPIINAGHHTAASPIITMPPSRAPHLPLGETHNHIGSNGSTLGLNTSLSTAAAPMTPTVTIPSSSPPPLPPHNNAHTSYSLNDSVVVVSDDRRHSPSVSSERSIPVPPRTKKQPLPPTPSGPIGRAPLPPPRKSNPSQMLRSHSADLVPLEIGGFGRQHQQSQQQHIGGIGTIAPNGCGSGKKMVKQHSTASQQSTSSTSSSVQSAPPATSSDTAKRQAPNRWSSHERIAPVSEHIMLQHNNQQQSPQFATQSGQCIGDIEHFIPARYASESTRSTGSSAGAGPGAAISSARIDATAKFRQPFISASHSLQSLCGKPHYGNIVGAATTSSQAIVTSSHSDTQMEEKLLLSVNADTTSLDGTIKKRKRRLRFPFGSKKSSSTNADNGSGSGDIKRNGSSKSKLI